MELARLMIHWKKFNIWKNENFDENDIRLLRKKMIMKRW